MASLVVGVWCRRRANVCQELGATLGHVGFSSPLAQTTIHVLSSEKPMKGQNQDRLYAGGSLSQQLVIQ